MGLTPRAEIEKSQKVSASHRNDVSPLTQGLRYRAACDIICVCRMLHACLKYNAVYNIKVYAKKVCCRKVHNTTFQSVAFADIRVCICDAVLKQVYPIQLQLITFGTADLINTSLELCCLTAAS